MAGTTLLVKIIQTASSPRLLIRQQYTAADMQVGWDRMVRGEEQLLSDKMPDVGCQQNNANCR